MNCPRCDTPYEPGVRYCKDCAEKSNSIPIVATREENTNAEQIKLDGREQKTNAPSAFCPNCGEKNDSENQTCKNCAALLENKPIGTKVTKPEKELQTFVSPNILTVVRKDTKSFDILNALLWGLLLLYLALVFLDYVGGSQLDKSAPQQGARAAMSAFWVIIGYCSVRALTEAFRSIMGK